MMWAPFVREWEGKTMDIEYQDAQLKLPDQQNGDLISRSALLNEFPAPENMADPEKVLVHVTGIWAAIEAAPVVDPVHHGR